jgi:hypothetical protein
VTLETRLWYVRGIGIVQIVRKETGGRPELGTTEIAYRLVARQG